MSDGEQDVEYEGNPPLPPHEDHDEVTGDDEEGEVIEVIHILDADPTPQ